MKISCSCYFPVTEMQAAVAANASTFSQNGLKRVLIQDSFQTISFGFSIIGQCPMGTLSD